jgi:pyruvate dehydrogenase (quinone)
VPEPDSTRRESADATCLATGEFNSELQNPDFVKLAEACGLPGWHVEREDQLEPAMRSWLSSGGPALLDARVSRMELVMPPKIELSQVASTALFGIKAVLDGRGREVIDLFRNNFLR